MTACHKRNAYPSFKQARCDASRICTEKPDIHLQGAYFCSECKMWHLTSQRIKGRPRWTARPLNL
jgi:hypothetical protein